MTNKNTKAIKKHSTSFTKDNYKLLNAKEAIKTKQNANIDEMICDCMTKIQKFYLIFDKKLIYECTKCNRKFKVSMELVG